MSENPTRIACVVLGLDNCSRVMILSRRGDRSMLSGTALNTRLCGCLPLYYMEDNMLLFKINTIFRKTKDNLICFSHSLTYLESFI
jgi:hypothetical protein